MSPAEQLRAAKALIDTPEKWTKGCNARAFDGASLDPRDVLASCFCSFGAMVHVEDNSDNRREADHALFMAVGEIAPFPGYISFNDADTTTHADVMALFDRAIELAGEPA